MNTPPSFDLDATIDILSRTPRVLDTLLRDIGPEWSRQNEGPGTWSAFEVVGHLIHGEETDWIPRARHILDCGEEQPFAPFDRFAQLERFKDWSLARLLDRFKELREDNLDTLRNLELGELEFERTGLHPEFGRVTLAQLLATWAVHDLNHLAQIARVMAKRSAADVGPWRKYLSVLR